MSRPAFLQTEKKESFKTWRFRFFMNLYPMYFGTGGKILFWSGDSTEVHVRIRRSIWTYNYVGTIFGGSMFSATDPFYMLMLYRIFSDDFVIWDRSAQIKFIKPSKVTLFTRYSLSQDILDSIKKEVSEKGENNYLFKIELLDCQGAIYALIERTVYIATKEYYRNKKGMTQSTRFSK
ncbi:MAG: DUF4442 domain-containing protein [Bacteroidota bacterium]